MATNDQYETAYRLLYEANEQSHDAVRVAMYAEASAQFLGYLADTVTNLAQQVGVLAQQMENVQASLASIDSKS